MRTAHSTLLIPTPRCLRHRMGEEVIVNGHHTTLELRGNATSVMGVGWEYTTGKSQVGAIGQLHRLVISFKRDDGQDGTKRFLFHNLHLRCTPDHNRGRVEEAIVAVADRVTLCHNLCAFVNGLLYLLLDRLQLLLRCHGAHIHVEIATLWAMP